MAVLMILSGMFGMGMSAVLFIAVLIKGTGLHLVVSAIFALAFVALFAWTVHIGFLLLTGKSKGWRWAIILFASQIPIVANSWIRYDWFTGIEVNTLLQLIGKNQKILFDVELGTGSHLIFDGGHGITHYGFNLFALFTVILLVRKRRQLIQAEATTGQ